MPKGVPLLMAALAALLPMSATADDNAPMDKLEKRAAWANDPTMHMVAIEALVVEVNENKTRDLGMHIGTASNDVSRAVEGSDFLFGRPLDPVNVPTLVKDPKTGEGSTALTPRLPGLGLNFHQMDISGATFSARLRALLDTGDAHITTRPIILALSGTQTQIHVGSRIPYQDVAPVIPTLPASTAVLQVADGEVGVKLDITPRILDLAARTVELNVANVEVSSLSRFITTQNIDRPVFNRANTQTRVTMRAGETFQLSSLKGRRRREVREGIPFLMNIPWLGRLFSSHEEVEENVDILFFITPHIVAPGENVMLPYDFKHRKDLVQQGLKLPEDQLVDSK